MDKVIRDQNTTIESRDEFGNTVNHYPVTKVSNILGIFTVMPYTNFINNSDFNIGLEGWSISDNVTYYPLSNGGRFFSNSTSKITTKLNNNLLNNRITISGSFTFNNTIYRYKDSKTLSFTDNNYIDFAYIDDHTFIKIYKEDDQIYLSLESTSFNLDIHYIKLNVGVYDTIHEMSNPEIEKLKIYGYTDRINDNILYNPDLKYNELGESLIHTTNTDMVYLSAWNFKNSSLISYNENNQAVIENDNNDISFGQISIINIENKTCTFTIKYKTDVETNLCVKIGNNENYYINSDYYTEAGEQTFTVTNKNVSLGESILDSGIWLTLKTKDNEKVNLTIDYMKLEIGDKPTPFIESNSVIESLKLGHRVISDRFN